MNELVSTLKLWPPHFDIRLFVITNIIAFFIVIAIFYYGKYRCAHKDNYKDPLLIKYGIWDLDGWSLTHFFTCLIAAYIYPSQWWLIWLYSLAWEIFEEYYDQVKPDFLKGFGDCFSTDQELGGDHTKWWFGRYSDIVMNTLGIMGALLYYRLKV
jgi:hypothetical protein